MLVGPAMQLVRQVVMSPAPAVTPNILVRIILNNSLNMVDRGDD
jgi:hypothetical protein